MTTEEPNEPGGEIVQAVPVDAASPSSTLFNTDDPVEVVERAARVADSLRDVITKRHLYKEIKGKNHVLVEGWQLLGSMLGVTAVCTETEEVDGGWKATVEARTMDGRVIGRADALCTKHERSGPWKNADDYARLSMAQTRATSKALKGPLGFVISLAGYEPTPEPEMSFAEDAGMPVEDATPVQDADPVTGKRAREIADEIEALGMLDRLPLVIGHLTGEQAADCSTVPKAAKAMRILTADQAEQVLVAANRKADEAVAA
jgi:hypothetical protein